MLVIEYGTTLLTEVGKANLAFVVRSGFISRSVQARLQVSVCSGYDLCDSG